VAEPAKKAHTGPPRFTGGKMPTFTRGGKVGAVINKNELLDLGDIYNDKATKGGASKGGASVAAE